MRDNTSCHRSLTKDSFIAEMTPVGWQWTLVAAPQRKERCAQFNLVRQGFVVYCPMVRRQIKHARMVSEVLRPLFPGYLFVQISQEARSWRPILSTIGVRAVIRSGNRPVSADHLVSALKALESASPAEGGQYKLGLAQNFEAILKTLAGDPPFIPLKVALVSAASQASSVRDLACL